MPENRLKRYESGKWDSSPVELKPLEKSLEASDLYVTIIQRDSNDKELESNWTNEIFNYLAASFKEIKGIIKIIIDRTQNDIIRIWTVVKKRTPAISNRIYTTELKVLEYLRNFDYDIDFHIITKEMATDIIDEKSEIILDRTKRKQSDGTGSTYI